MAPRVVTGTYFDLRSYLISYEPPFLTSAVRVVPELYFEGINSLANPSPFWTGPFLFGSSRDFWSDALIATR